MRKNDVMRLCALMLASMMVLSLFACNNGGGNTTTESTTESKTEATVIETVVTTEETTTEKTETQTSDTSTTEATTSATTENTQATTEESTTEEETGCYHPYVGNSEGHFKDACDICGKGIGKTMSHEYELRHEDEGDLFLYRYMCTICKYVAYRQEVPYGLGLFISPAELSESDYYSFSSAKFAFEDGQAFARFTTQGASNGAFVYAYNSADTTSHTGNYMVIKVRLGGNRTNLKISVSSTESAKLVAEEEKGQSGATQGRLEAVATGLTPDWAVVVIDLTKVNKDGKYGYVGRSGDYMLRELRIYMDENSSFSGEEYLDIGYIMLCDTMEEVRSFTKNERGLYTYPNILEDNKPTVEGNVCVHSYTYDKDGHAVGACDICGASEGDKVPHNYGFLVEGNTYRYGCVCGFVLKEKTIPENIEKYIGPNNLINGNKAPANVKNEGLMADDDGTVFTRITGPSGEFYTIWNDETNFDPGKAKYAVIKMRTNVQSSPAQHAVRFYICHTDVEKGVDRLGVMLSQKLLETDDWLTIVIDMEAIFANKGASAYTADADGNFPTINRLFVNMWSPAFDNAANGYYYDYAYFAFCDSWEEIDFLVDERTVEYMDDANGNSTTRTTDGAIATDPEHTYDADNSYHWHNCDGCSDSREDHTFASVLEDGVYTVTCTVCGYTVKKNVPAGATFVSPQRFAEIGVSGSLDKSGVKTGGDGTAYVRVTNTKNSKNYGEIYPVSHSKPSNIIPGTNKYAVIKLRTSEGALDALRFRVGHNNGGENFNQSDVYGSIDLNYKAVKANVWTVFVVDLTAFSNIDYKLGGGGYYPEITNMNIQISLNAGKTVDYAYIAICSDWEMIDALVDEGSVQYVLTGGVTETRAPDGSAFTGEEETVDTSAEQTTEKVEQTTEKVEDNTEAESASKNTTVLDSDYLGNISISNNIVSGGVLTDDDGTKYLHITNNGSSMTYGEIYPVQHSQPAPIEPGLNRYLVIKLRSDAAIPDVIRVRIGHNHGGPDCNVIETYGSVSLDKSFLVAGEWTVFVIDMSAMANYDYKITGTGTYPTITRHNLQFSLNAGQSVDIAYIGVCYDWAAIDAIVEESEICYILESGKGEIRAADGSVAGGEETTENTEDETAGGSTGSCDDDAHTYVEARNGDTWTYKCSACGDVMAEKTVPAGAVYLSSVYLGARSVANATNNGLMADSDGTTYARITTNEGQTGFEYRPVLHASPAAINPGNNKYLVMKLRSSKAGSEIRLWFGNNAGGDGYNESINKSMLLPMSKLKSTDDWVVIVVDLEAMYPAVHRKLESGVYPEITNLYGYFAHSAGEHYDIAYMAICEDWTAIDTLVDESTVEYMTGSAASTTVNASGPVS